MSSVAFQIHAAANAAVLELQPQNNNTQASASHALNDETSSLLQALQLKLKLMPALRRSMSGRNIPAPAALNDLKDIPASMLDVLKSYIRQQQTQQVSSCDQCTSTGEL